MTRAAAEKEKKFVLPSVLFCPSEDTPACRRYCVFVCVCGGSSPRGREWKSVGDNLTRRCPQVGVERFPLILQVSLCVFMPGRLWAPTHKREQRRTTGEPLDVSPTSSSSSRHGGRHLHPGRRVQELRRQGRLRRQPEQGGVPQPGDGAVAQLRQGWFFSPP